MSKRQVLSVLGVIVMIFLFLGVPTLWHKIIALVTGLLIIAISYNLDQDQGKINSGDKETFIENKPL